MSGAMTLIDRPIFIIGCNRSGTTLLFRTLCAHPLLWTHYEESQHVYHRFFPIDAKLGEAVPHIAPSPMAEAIVHQLYREGHNKEYFKDHWLLRMIHRKALQRFVNRLYKRPPIRLLEKTPANCFRIPLLSGLFPDGRFVFLVRRPEDTISSLMEGWKLGLARVLFERDSSIQSKTLRSLRWHYLVPPGWSEWAGRPLEEICAFQWVSSVEQAWSDLNEFCPDRFLLLRHEDAVRNPEEVYGRLFHFLDLPPSSYFSKEFARLQSMHHTHGGSNPAPNKWKRLHPDEIEAVRPRFQDLKDTFYQDE